MKEDSPQFPLQENLALCLISYFEEIEGTFQQWMEKTIKGMTPIPVALDEPKWNGKMEFEFASSEQLWKGKGEEKMEGKNLHMKPLTHLFVVCNEEMEQWNNSLKGKMKQWIQEANQRKVEWMIVHLCTNQRSAASQIASKFVGNVFQKMKSEFAMTDKRDRICQLRPLEKDTKQWEDFILKLRENVVYSFNKMIVQYEDECRKLSAERMKEDWDLYLFYEMKEGLSFAFQRMGILQKAWQQYFELDAAFSDSNVRRRFVGIGRKEELDTEGDFFDLERKEYQKQIAEKKLSEFGVRTIIFIRQTLLLLAQHRYSRVAKRSLDFFQRMNVLLCSSISSSFIYAWIFHSSLQISKKCEEGLFFLSSDSSHHSLSNSLSSSFNSLSESSENSIEENSSELRKSVNLSNSNNNNNNGVNASIQKEEENRLHYLIGDLYFMARRSLDHLQSCFLPLSSSLNSYSTFPFYSSSSIDLIPSSNNSLGLFSASSNLSSILSSRDSFDREYLAITQKTEDHYKEGNKTKERRREKRMMGLKEDRATLDFARGKYEMANLEFLRLYSIYLKEGWNYLAFQILSKASIGYLLLHSHEKYLHVSFLKLDPKFMHFLSSSLRSFYWNEILSISESSSSSFNELNISPVIDHQILFDNPKDSLIEITSGSLLSLSCNFCSHLPQEVKFDEMYISLIPKEGIATNDNRIKLLPTSELVLFPGQIHSFVFQVEIITKGAFVIESVNLRKGKVTFSENVEKDYEGKRIKVIGSKPTARIRGKKASGIIIWNNVQLLHVSVETGMDDLHFGNIKITADSKSPTQVTFPDLKEIDVRIRDVQQEGESRNQVTFKASGNERHIPLPSPLKPFQLVDFFIPIVGHYQPKNPQFNCSSIRFDLTYRKHTKEDFLITVELAVEFDFPFEMSYHVVALEKKVFLQLLMQSMVSSSIKLKDYKLSLPSEFTLSNSFTVEDIAVGPRELASLLFELNLDPQFAFTKEEYPFEIKTQYSLLEPQSHPLLIDHPLLNNDFHFQKEFMVQIPKVFYRIETKFPEETTVGSFLPVRFEIFCFSSISENLQYEIAVDKTVWMLSGKKSLKFSLKEGGKIEFFCRLLPITSGFLPLPKISLLNNQGMRIEDRHVIISNEHVQCRVGSPATFVSALVEARLAQ